MMPGPLAAPLALDRFPSREHGPRAVHVVALSARTPNALRAKKQRYAQRLCAATAAADEFRRRANAAPQHGWHRLAAVAGSPAALAWQLAAFVRDEAPAGVIAGTRGATGAPAVAFLFTGLGSEFAGMGRRLFTSQPVFRRELERCDRLFRAATGRPLLSTTDPPFGDVRTTDDTERVQPAVFAFEFALARLWRSWGVEPSAVFGHSLGEDVAACVVGVVSLQDALALVAARARLMRELPAGGAMAAIFAEEEHVRRAIAAYGGRIAVAAINGPTNTVVSGSAELVDDLVARLDRQRIRSRRVKASRAFHSALMEPMLAAFEAVASGVTFGAPRIPIVSSVTGSWAGAGEMTDAGYWRRRLREPVRFADGVRLLYAQGHRVFVEIGPHPTLLGMARRCVPEADVTCAPTLRRDDDDVVVATSSLAKAFVRGVDVRWSALEPGAAPRPAALSIVEVGS